MDFIPVQLAKACIPIFVTPSGIIIDVIAVRLKKRLSLISETPLGIEISPFAFSKHPQRIVFSLSSYIR